jgi:hypothetical protein
MGMSAQQKMLHVADRLGLTTLKDMQGTTRMVYDSITTGGTNFTFFKGASQRPFPLTNVGANGNQFQVNEALLVEKIGFFVPANVDGVAYNGIAEVGVLGTFVSVKFDLVIGNKTVIKDATVEAGGEQAFYNDGLTGSSVIDLEGVGILIPPQVEYYVVAKAFDTRTRQAVSIRLGCYLFGTGALLNFNTTI